MGCIITQTAVLSEQQFKMLKNGYYIQFPHLNRNKELIPARLYSGDEVLDILGLSFKEHYSDEESYLVDCERIDKEIYYNDYFICGGIGIVEDLEEEDCVDWSRVKVGDQYVIIRAHYSE